MVGGPYKPQLPSLEDKPALTKVLLAALERHLGRRLPEPAFVDVSHHSNCIPTMTPGHLGRMAELRDSFSGPPWNGRLEVIGAGIGGVSVGDCVSQGRSAGKVWLGNIQSRDIA